MILIENRCFGTDERLILNEFDQFFIFLNFFKLEVKNMFAELFRVLKKEFVRFG